MPGLEKQELAFEFFCEHLESQAVFEKEDLRAATDWTDAAVNTYWSKQFRPFVRRVGSDQYRVSEAFRPFATWERFRQHVTQVRHVTATDYKYSPYDSVLVYEFFMPLTNEAALRGTLDALFYKDTILSKLRACKIVDLEAQIERESGAGEDVYLERLCAWVGERFVGYSISHVSGRFRSEDICTRAEAAEIEKNRRYLIDETTAVTRFIFPCSNSEDADRVRWFFQKLFIDSIIDVVNGEDEIWMVESGMRNRLHIWKVEKED